MLGYPVVISSECCFSCADALRTANTIAHAIVRIRFIVIVVIVSLLRCRNRIACDREILISGLGEMICGEGEEYIRALPHEDMCLRC